MTATSRTGAPTLSIGQRNESSLHAALKAWCCRPGDVVEGTVEGYLIDVVRGDQLIEIQTSNFSGIKRKLASLLERHKIQVIHPVAREKWIVRVSPDTGEILSRRRSPKKGVVADVFDELVSLPELICHPNLMITVLLTVEEEIWCPDGLGSWRRRGVSIKDRVLVEVLEQHDFATPADFLSFIPTSLEQPFTNRSLAQSSGLALRLCRKITYCLRKMHVLTVAGKNGNELLFSETVAGEGIN